MEEDPPRTILTDFHVPKLEEECILTIFHRIAKEPIDIFSGVDKDIGNLPEKRVRKPPTYTPGASILLDIQIF